MRVANEIKNVFSSTKIKSIKRNKLLVDKEIQVNLQTRLKGKGVNASFQDGDSCYLEFKPQLKEINN